ncbi:MAG: fibronectin type III domain-containing protein [Desulfobacterales bacterium]
MLETKRAVIIVKLRLSALLMTIAVFVMTIISGCGEYRHIPLASKKTTAENANTVQVTLQWKPVPNAAQYNVYWSRFPGVTKHNGHKIPDAANPIVIKDLESDTTYYFVVTVVNKAGESRESREMSFAAMGAAGEIDFKELFGQPEPSLPPSAVKQEEKKPAKQAAVATRGKTPYSGTTKATLAWDSVPNAISYNIYWRSQPGVTKQNSKKIANVKSPHTLKNLIPGKTYYLVVTAVGPNGESSISEEISYRAK